MELTLVKIGRVFYFKMTKSLNVEIIIVIINEVRDNFKIRVWT